MPLARDPVSPTEYVPGGVVEAIKTRHPIYAVLLRFTRHLAKWPPPVRWGLLIGGLVVQKFLGGLAETTTSPRMASLSNSVVAIYVAIAVLVWLARPVYNLLLRLHPVGRRTLSVDEVRETNWLGGYFAAALLCLLLSCVPGWGLLQLPAFCLALSTLALSCVFRSSDGWPQTTMIGIVAALGILTIVWPVAVRTGEPDLETQFSSWFWLVLIGGIVVGQLITALRPKP